MSDIAMLVAEEYERRTKNFKKSGAAVVAEGEFSIVPWASILAVTRRMKEKVVGVDKRELDKWVREPKSQIAIAASNSFFSA